MCNGERVTYACGHFYDLCRPREWCQVTPDYPETVCAEHVLHPTIDKYILRSDECDSCSKHRQEGANKERERLQSFVDRLSGKKTNDEPSVKDSQEPRIALPEPSYRYGAERERLRLAPPLVRKMVRSVLDIAEL